MSRPYNVKFFGLCADGNHNKVWGYITVVGDVPKIDPSRLSPGRDLAAQQAAMILVNTRYYIFWGKCGAKSLSMAERDCHQIDALKRGKTKQGRSNGAYIPVREDMFEEIYPNFYEVLEESFCILRLKQKF